MATTEGVRTGGYLLFLQAIQEILNMWGWNIKTAEELDDETVYDMWEEGFSPMEAAGEMNRE